MRSLHPYCEIPRLIHVPQATLKLHLANKNGLASSLRIMAVRTQALHDAVHHSI